jgi:nicotinamide mononucleotide transporter
MEALFSLFGQSVSALELVAVLTGLWGVWLTAKANMLCFPIGLINVLAYAVLFFHSSVRLYADGTLQLIFGALLLFGWYRWKKEDSTAVVIVTTTSGKTLIVLTIIAATVAIVLGQALYVFTDAAFPRVDATLTSISLVAQWMVARKKIENWLLWLAVDLLYIPIYWHRNLPLTAMLYAVYLILAINGYLSWKKRMAVKLNDNRTD